MAFVKCDDIGSRHFRAADVGPALWPVAFPAWAERVAFIGHRPRWRSAGASLTAVMIHLGVVVVLLAHSQVVDIPRIAQRSRLTLLNFTVATAPDQPAEVNSAQIPELQPQPRAVPVPIEWVRVQNWGPADGENSSIGSDATALLAGLGASGPAGPAEGVNDPYAGASPIWSGRGAKSALLLKDAPNPAILDEIRAHIALSIPGLRGRAQLTVVFDGSGVVTKVLSTATDLPQIALRKLEDALVGRVIAKVGQGPGQLRLPDITFS